VADAGVDDVALERDAPALELGARGRDVVHVQGDRVAVRVVLDAQRRRVDQRERERAGLVLGAEGIRPSPDARAGQAEDVAVELARCGEVLGGDRDEVDAGDK
jgi:hypothetical protein